MRLEFSIFESFVHGEQEMNAEDFREPSEPGRQLLAHLLAKQFEGRNELLEQLRNVKAQSWPDGSGSLFLRVSDDSPIANVKVRVPVEADVEDLDGIKIYVLLHVTNGRAAELEIYKADGGTIQRDLRPALLNVWT